jgi:nickel/cobalt exporter
VTALVLAAAGLGFLHTLVGPDHYLPFVFLARSLKWSMKKLWLVVFLCGLGHVLSSILLGMAGLALGIGVASLEGIESSRGAVALWLLVAFGFGYMIYGLHLAILRKRHRHAHLHGEGPHEHEHDHATDHAHLHGDPKKVTPWILFLVFVFGPCEPLIPLFIYPAARHSWGTVWAVSIAFGVVTVGTMLALTTLLTLGATRLNLGRLERWEHALAGLLIGASGVAIIAFGL